MYHLSRALVLKKDLLAEIENFAIFPFAGLLLPQGD